MDKQVRQKVQTVISNIRVVRKYRNYSQYDIASKLYISQNAYSGIEQGRSRLSIARFTQIANILDVHISWLLTVENPTKKDFNQLAPDGEYLKPKWIIHRNNDVYRL